MSLHRDLYRAARLSNDMSALMSGDPARIRRRLRNKLIGRAIGRAGGWRLLWGGGGYAPAPPARPRHRRASQARTTRPARRRRTGGWRTLWEPRP